MLTTEGAVKSYLGAKAGAYTDAQITAAVAWASAAVSSYCDRMFEATDYAEWIDGSGTAYLRLLQYPIITLRRALLDSFECMRLGNSAVGAVGASVAVHGGKLHLTVVGGASAGTDSLTLVTYTTLTLLRTAILALAHGWTVTVVTEARPKDLRPTGLSGALLVEVGIEAPDEAQTSDARPESSSGLLYSAGSWPQGVQNIFADYRAGYETIPDDLAFVAIRLAADLLGSPEINLDMSSMRLGDYAYTINTAAKGLLAEKYAAELAAYRRLAI